MHLIAFSNTRIHKVQRVCVEHRCEQQVVLLATTLTEERWRPLEEGRLHVFTDGSELEGEVPP